jgi:uncharacterized protein YukE
MSDNIKKMDYAEADQMIKILNEACNQLRETIGEVESIAGVLEGGALLGKAGDAFANGIRKQLVGSINRLIDGLDDGAKYVAMEKEDMMAAEQKSAKLF